MIGKLTAFHMTGPFQAELTWDDGFAATLDFAPILAAHAVLAPLGDASVFAHGALSQDGWSIEWPNGIDFGAPQLRVWAAEQKAALTAAQ